MAAAEVRLPITNLGEVVGFPQGFGAKQMITHDLPYGKQMISKGTLREVSCD